jgi:hypothetical protein
MVDDIAEAIYSTLIPKPAAGLEFKSLPDSMKQPWREAAIKAMMIATGNA